MDPVGPWSAYASYNRLTGVQAGAASADFHHHLASGGSGLGSHSGAAGAPSTTNQLLLQAAAAHTTLAGQLSTAAASPFNPGGFLSPPAVGYDAVFTPLFHHPNPKPAHYSSTLQAQHRQVIAQAAQAAASKQSTVESELSSLRENYSSHHQSLAAQGSSFFDQSSTPGGASSLPWQGNNQLPSPFGILPHESVVPSSPNPTTTKSSTAASAYENFNAHFAAAQLNNHLNSQLSGASKQAARTGAGSPATAKPTASSASSSFYQTPSTFGSQADNISTYSTSNAKNSQISSQQDYAKQRASAGSTVAPASQQPAVQDTTNKIMDKKLSVPVTGPGSGFMASYLKFLQGERDTSPPPAGRGARKATWSRTNTTKPYAEQVKSQADVQQTNPHSNGALTATPVNQGMSMSTSSAHTMHVANALGQSKNAEDDARYYDMNKERKRKYEGEGYDADDDARRLNKPVLNVPSAPLNDKNKKCRSAPAKPPPALPQPAVPKKSRAPQPAPVQVQPQQQYYYQQPDEGALQFLDFHFRNRQRW